MASKAFPTTPPSSSSSCPAVAPPPAPCGCCCSSVAMAGDDGVESPGVDTASLCSSVSVVVEGDASDAISSCSSAILALCVFTTYHSGTQRQFATQPTTTLKQESLVFRKNTAFIVIDKQNNAMVINVQEEEREGGRERERTGQGRENMWSMYCRHTQKKHSCWSLYMRSLQRVQSHHLSETLFTAHTSTRHMINI